MSALAHKLLEEFKDKEYAHSYMEEALNAHIATQIKVLREKMGWTQEQLAEKAQMQQARISVLENINYSSWSINTLRKLAKAFDLVLRVSFENFSVGIRNLESLSKESLLRIPREEDLRSDEIKDKQQDIANRQMAVTVAPGAMWRAPFTLRGTNITGMSYAMAYVGQLEPQEQITTQLLSKRRKVYPAATAWEAAQVEAKKAAQF